MGTISSSLLFYTFSFRACKPDFAFWRNIVRGQYNFPQVLYTKLFYLSFSNWQESGDLFNFFYLWLVLHKIYADLNFKSEFIRNWNIMFQNFKSMLQLAFLDFSNHLLCKNYMKLQQVKLRPFSIETIYRPKCCWVFQHKNLFEKFKNITCNLNNPLLLWLFIFKSCQIFIINVVFLPKLGQYLHCIWYYDETKMEHKSCSRVEL